MGMCYVGVFDYLVFMLDCRWPDLGQARHMLFDDVRGWPALGGGSWPALRLWRRAAWRLTRRRAPLCSACFGPGCPINPSAPPPAAVECLAMPHLLHSAVAVITIIIFVATVMCLVRLAAAPGPSPALRPARPLPGAGVPEPAGQQRSQRGRAPEPESLTCCTPAPAPAPAVRGRLQPQPDGPGLQRLALPQAANQDHAAQGARTPGPATRLP
jgi:hypothetical protein